MKRYQEKFFENSSTRIVIQDIFPTLFTDLSKSKTIILQLIKRDTYSQFRQQITGVLWLIISPLVSVIGYLVMYTLGILKPGSSSYPYFIFLIIGVGLWGLMAVSTSTIASSLVNQGDLILRTNIPIIAIPFSSSGRILLAYISHLASLSTLMLIFKVPVGKYWILYPIFSLLPILYGIGFGLIFSIWQVVSREINSLVQVALQLGFFLTPALFNRNLPLHRFGVVLKFNPLSYIVETPRSILLERNPIGLVGFGWSLLLSICTLLFGFVFFYKKSSIIAERL